jgi:hypothetical protein
MKRKIPFINSHIFRQPDIPWGSGAFDPFSLNPDLFLDASDLSANIIASGVDDRSVAILDQSASLAEIYEQNYTILNNVDCSTLTNNGGGSYSIAGGGVFGVNDPRSLNILGVVYAVKFTISNLVGSGDLSISFARNNTTYDVSRTSTATIPFSNGSHTVYMIVISQDTSQYVKFQDLTGLDFDISDISSTEIQGSHFTQTTAANRGLVDSATVPTQISYLAGNAEFSENTLNVAKFAAMSQGSVVWINDGVDGAYQFTIGDESDAKDWMGFNTVSGKIRIVYYDAGVIQLLLSTSSVVADDVIECRTDGATWQIFINGVEDVVDNGIYTNDGRFFSSITDADVIYIARLARLTTAYSDTTFKHLSIFSTPLTDAQSADYANYLIEKHN